MRNVEPSSSSDSERNARVHEDVFARGGETLDDGSEGFSVMAESPDHGTVTVRSQSRGRACCQVAPEIVRSVEEIGPSDGD